MGPSIEFHMSTQKLKHVELQQSLGFKHASQLTELLRPTANPKWQTIIKVADALNLSVKTLVVTAQFLKDEANEINL
jgi:hypothetical protein